MWLFRPGESTEKEIGGFHKKLSVHFKAELAAVWSGLGLVDILVFHLLIKQAAFLVAEKCLRRNANWNHGLRKTAEQKLATSSRRGDALVRGHLHSLLSFLQSLFHTLLCFRSRANPLFQLLTVLSFSFSL